MATQLQCEKRKFGCWITTHGNVDDLVETVLTRAGKPWRGVSKHLDVVPDVQLGSEFRQKPDDLVSAAAHNNQKH